MFSSGSFSSISLATVTPSLVMSGEPNFFSITTLRPLGPSVTFTASARMFTPRRIDCRDSSPCRICFAIVSISLILAMCQNLFGTSSERSRGLLGDEGRLRSAFQDAEDFFFTHDEEVFAVDLDLGAGILAEQHAIARLHVEGEGFALVVGLASADGDNFAFLRLVLGTVGDDDATPGGFGLFYTTNYNAVMQGSELSSHSSDSFPAWAGRFKLDCHTSWPTLARSCCFRFGVFMDFEVTRPEH